MALTKPNSSFEIAKWPMFGILLLGTMFKENASKDSISLNLGELHHLKILEQNKQIMEVDLNLLNLKHQFALNDIVFSFLQCLGVCFSLLIAVERTS